MRLYFDPTKFPRSIGRKEWREIWRWKRRITKELRAIEQMQRERLADKNLANWARQDIIDRLINPPLLIHDKQDPK